MGTLGRHWEHWIELNIEFGQTLGRHWADIGNILGILGRHWDIRQTLGNKEIVKIGKSYLI
jgi:hypothetical protein